MSEKTCGQCRHYEYCMERSRMYPCRDFVKRSQSDEASPGLFPKIAAVILFSIAVLMVEAWM